MAVPGDGPVTATVVQPREGARPMTGLPSIYVARPDLLDAALAAELDRITTDYTRLGLARSHIRERLVAALEGGPK